MSGDRAEILDHSFSRQAAAFEDRRFNAVFTEDVDWLFARLELHPDQLLLDVAAGTGHAGRRLAPAVRCVIALDATTAMLEHGRRASAAAGVHNIVFARGDAGSLPFLDESFDIVVCRFAVHHFDDPRVEIAEMARCVRPGGSLVIADLAADDDPSAAAVQNRLERLRDPSHTRILTTVELARLIEESGVPVRAIDARTVDRPLAAWLAQTAATEDVAAEIRAALHDELDGSRPTGFRPVLAAGELRFTQRFVSVTADRPRP